MANGNGETQKNLQPGDFDARLQFLLQSSESLHANLQELHAQMAQQSSEITRQKKETDERFDKVLSATENLLAIVRSHQDRLNKLDPGEQQ